jgi:plastocyanin
MEWRHGRRTFLATLGTVALAGCGGGQEGVEADMEITVTNNKFEPQLAVVEPGATIQWRVEEGEHTTTAYHSENEKPNRIPEDARPWDSGDMTGSDEETFHTTLETEGVYDYFCDNHFALGMVGSIVVGDNDDKDQPGLSEPTGVHMRAAVALSDLNEQAAEELGIELEGGVDEPPPGI